MSNESFEVCSSTFIFLSLFALLCKFILYLLYRSCSSFPFGTNLKGELAVQGLWPYKARLDYPRETKRHKRSYLHQYPRNLPDSSCMPSVNRWDSAFAAVFHVIQQILAEGQRCARNRGREDEWGVVLPMRTSWSGKVLGCFLCSAGGCLWGVRTAGDRSLGLAEMG